jgi:hypothetical protein
VGSHFLSAKPVVPASGQGDLVVRPPGPRRTAVTDRLEVTPGVPAVEAAREAGHGVAVLLKIYTHCINGQPEAANQRIAEALARPDYRPDPGGKEGNHTEDVS